MFSRKYKTVMKSLSVVLMAAVCSVTFSACVYDTLEDVGPEEEWSVPEGETRYALVSVKLTDPVSPSRSQNLENFEDGKDFESAINLSEDAGHFIIFFDRTYKYLTHSELKPVNVKPDADRNNLYETVFSVKFRNPAVGNVTPSYSLVALNTIGMKEQLDKIDYGTATINDILKMVDEDDMEHSAGCDGQYFTMTSSAYFKKDEATGNYLNAIAEPLNPAVFFPTREEAEEEDKPIVAYVERAVAKVSVQFMAGDGGETLVYKPTDTKLLTRVHYIGDRKYSSRHSWTAALTGWGVNNIETKNTFFKNLAKPDERGNTVFPQTGYTEINGKNRPFFGGWNSENNRRSHWSVDPHYGREEGHYAWQYRRALDNSEYDEDGFSRVKAYSTPPGNDYFSTRYITFNQMVTDIVESPFNSEEWSVNRPWYETENTFDHYVKDGHYTYQLGSTSIVVGGKILLSGMDTKSASYDIYVDRDNIFYTTKEDFITNFRLMMRSALESAEDGRLSFTYYKFGSDVAADAPFRNGEKMTVSVGHDERGRAFKLYLGTDSLTRANSINQQKFYIPALIENGDGKVIPWIDGLQVAREREDGTLEVVPLTPNQLKSIIYAYAGAYEHYNQGRMYYSVPLVHNVDQQTAGQVSYVPGTGDYGFVRNHWYRIKIHGVNLRGMPVDDPNQELVPYVMPFDDSIAAEFQVLPWHELKTDVTLDDGSFNLK